MKKNVTFYAEYNHNKFPHIFADRCKFLSMVLVAACDVRYLVAPIFVKVPQLRRQYWCLFGLQIKLPPFCVDFKLLKSTGHKCRFYEIAKLHLEQPS